MHHPLRVGAVALALIGLVFTSGCEALKQIEQGQQAAAGGVGNQDPPPDPPPTIEINSIQENRGLTTGGELIRIIGFGFEREEVVRVFFGSSEADPAFVEVESDTSIRLVTPQHPQPEWVVVRVVAGQDAGLLENGFEFFDPVGIISIDPSRGPTAGGQLIAIIGTGLVDGTEVTFGAAPPIAATPIDLGSLTVAAPPLPRGDHSVTVTNANGTATLPGAFRTFEPVALDGVFPFAGPIAGNTDIIVSGAGFVDPTILKVGTSTLANTPNTEETRMTATTVMANPAVEGPVALRAQNNNGSAILNDAFVYYDPTDTTPRVIAVTPNAGLIEGGREVNVVVGGMPDTSSEVFFGNQAGENCVVHDAFMITCEAPPAPEGLVNVRVINGTTEVVALDGFNYIDLQIATILPSRGAIAGGTYVRMFGSGFGPNSRVYFDGRQAVDVEARNPTEITLRTPPGAIGVVPIRIETQGVELTVADLYEYFDPADFAHWTGGGPIDGAINVTVYDGGSPIDNAYVIVGPGVDTERPYLSGFTDARGQITLSGPDVIGQQTVSAGKPGYGAFTFAEVDARNLTLLISQLPPPPPDPLPECPQGGGAPPLIEGNVYRIKDEWNKGNDYVLVTTTYRSFGEPLPDPGPNSQMINQGDYELFARTGDLMVLALAGEVTPENTLDVHAMGFHPFLFTEPSSGEACQSDADCVDEAEQCRQIQGQGVCIRVYEDIDVIIDTPLNQPMRVELENPPLERPGEPLFTAPTDTGVFVWYDFGYLGQHPMENLMVPGTDVVEVSMPKRLPVEIDNISKFGVQAGVYTMFGGDTYPPWSEVYMDGLTDTSQSVIVTPMLKTHIDNPPSLTLAPPAPLDFGFNLRPTDIPDVDATGNFHIIFDVEMVTLCVPSFPMPRTLTRWMVVAPGFVYDFDLPRFPLVVDGANMPPGQHYWQMMALYSPGVNFNNLDLFQLMDWHSSAVQLSQFASQ